MKVVVHQYIGMNPDGEAFGRLRACLQGLRLRTPTSSQKQPHDDPSRPKGFGSAPIWGRAFFIPSCAIELNWVAPGHFQMGSPAGEVGRSNDEGPQTQVTISRGFWPGKFPVTQEEWKTVAESVSGLKAEPSYFRGQRLPVEQVSWDDCSRLPPSQSSFDRPQLLFYDSGRMFWFRWKRLVGSYLVFKVLRRP
jgi:hypothetical protein